MRGKSVWRIKEDIYKWLTRLGVHEGDITIKAGKDNKEKAVVRYVFKGQDYELSTAKASVYTKNLHFIELLIHSRVLGIERGIETLEQAFAGYTALPDYTNASPFQVLGVPENSSLDLCKKKFKQLAKLYHPDVNEDEGSHFLRLKNALEAIIILKNDEGVEANVES